MVVGVSVSVPECPPKPNLNRAQVILSIDVVTSTDDYMHDHECIYGLCITCNVNNSVSFSKPCGLERNIIIIMENSLCEYCI